MIDFVSVTHSIMHNGSVRSRVLRWRSRHRQSLQPQFASHHVSLFTTVGIFCLLTGIDRALGRYLACHCVLHLMTYIAHYRLPIYQHNVQSNFSCDLDELTMHA